MGESYQVDGRVWRQQSQRQREWHSTEAIYQPHRKHKRSLRPKRVEKIRGSSQSVTRALALEREPSPVGSSAWPSTHSKRNDLLNVRTLYHNAKQIDG